jgi:hypothetical protein
MSGWSKNSKIIFKLFSNKNQPSKPKISPVSRSNHKKNNDFHEQFTPNVILEISAILKKVQKQKQVKYLGYLDNISAFTV